MLEEPEGIRIDLVYNSDLFDERRITELLDQLRVILEQVVADPERPLSEVSLRTPRAKEVLPDPTVALDDSWPGSIQQLFDEQLRILSRPPGGDSSRAALELCRA